MVVPFLVRLVVCKRRNGKEINNKFASIPFTIYMYFFKIELKHISSSLICGGEGGGGGGVGRGMEWNGHSLVASPCLLTWPQTR